MISWVLPVTVWAHTLPHSPPTFTYTSRNTYECWDLDQYCRDPNPVSSNCFKLYGMNCIKINPRSITPPHYTKLVPNRSYMCLTQFHGRKKSFLRVLPEKKAFINYSPYKWISNKYFGNKVNSSFLSYFDIRHGLWKNMFLRGKQIIVNIIHLGFISKCWVKLAPSIKCAWALHLTRSNACHGALEPELHCFPRPNQQLQVPAKKYRTNTNIEHHFFNYVIQIDIYWSVSDMDQEIKIMR